MTKKLVFVCALLVVSLLVIVQVQENRLLDANFWYTAMTDDVAKILAAGADIETCDDDEATPLHWAARVNKKPEVVSLLLDAGANIEARTVEGHTPLHSALTSVDDWLFSEWEELLTDIESQTEVVALLLERGADINASDKYGTTPLHDAAARGIPKVVALLLEKGADINAKDRYGATPLHWAAGYRGGGTPEVVDLLLNAGADIEARDNNGATPLHEVVALLIDWLSETEDLYGEGLRPLYEVVKYMQPSEVVNLLLDKGANVKAQDNDGNTPFDLAKESEHLKGSDVFLRLNDAQYR